MPKPYKKVYIIECEVCHAITQVKRATLFGKLGHDMYRTFNKKDEVIWVRTDNWYIYDVNKLWSITDETVLCPMCAQTVKLAKELCNLGDEEIKHLREEMRKV